MHVTLVMICKNEEAVIARALSSVKPYVHSWLIADNGSTDATCEIVEREMAGLPGKLVRTDWKGFAANRNEAFREAEKLGFKDQYLFMLDADDSFVAEPDFEWPSTRYDGYKIRVTHDGESQGRAHLFKGGIGWMHKGRIHEYSATPSGLATLGDLKKCTYVSGRDGARSLDPARWNKDAELLLEELKDHPNDPRSMFYLGRSYLYAGKLELALDAFEKRVKLVGWHEERWYASYERLRVAIAMGKPKDVLISYALESYAMLPSRSEPLWEIAVWLRENDRIKEAFPFAVAATNIPRPRHNGIFINEEIYHWKALDEAAVSAYWVGRFDDALEANKELQKLAPPHAQKRIQENINACSVAMGIIQEVQSATG